MCKRVLIAMSGGIDSSVSALLLKEAGYELVGVTFRTFDHIKESCMAREKGCCSVESIFEAKHFAEGLGIEHHILDFREIFKENVIKNFIEEYKNGRTPNPCVLCNSHIKWGELLTAADTFGCDLIATGHYASIREHNGHHFLHTVADTHKDQTYFLWMLTEENLKRTIFPLGDLTKPQVREIAMNHNLKTLATKSESQEICFVTDNDYRHFLSEQGCVIEEGNFIDTNGNVIGRHKGYCNYTIGQRKGLGVAFGTPKYVTNIDASKNEVTLGDRNDLFCTEISISDVRIRDIDWLRASPDIFARIRYKSPATKAKIIFSNDYADTETATIIFDEPVWGAAPGQSMVLYKEGLVVGGGIIEG